jgi:hypothetical protein
MGSQRNAIRMSAAAGMCALAIGFSAPVRAVDGVIEINQASVKAAGGFPFEIGKSGSYRLTSNLDVTDDSARAGGAAVEATTAIKVSTSYVTIDLNGFSIVGPTVCTGAPATVTCTPDGIGVGVDAQSESGVTVVNGIVRGFGGGGLRLGKQSRVERVVVESNAFVGVVADAVIDCTVNSNKNNGVENAGTVINTIADENGGDGIIGASVVANCTARRNHGNGIEATTVSNSTVDGNVGIGIFAKTAIGCTAIGGSTQLSANGVAGHNICGPGFTPCP